MNPGDHQLALAAMAVSKFDPNCYQEGLLEAFMEFGCQYNYSYEALGRKPPESANTSNSSNSCHSAFSSGVFADAGGSRPMASYENYIGTQILQKLLTGPPGNNLGQICLPPWLLP